MECGAYRVDLALWETLATGAERSRVLDLGAGTGRVSLHLARCGHAVTALDADPELLDELRRRGRALGLEVGTTCADARDFDLGREFDLVVAPMQLVHLMPTPAERIDLLECSRAHLRPGGLFAAALLDLHGEAVGEDYAPSVPDMSEQDGWVYSSRPVAVRIIDSGAAISLDRMRRAVSPGGEVSEQLSQVRLELVSPPDLESEARAAGLVPGPRHWIPPTEDHVGSVVVTASRAAE
jgi:SAM-dependent methyltransferase